MSLPLSPQICSYSCRPPYLLFGDNSSAELLQNLVYTLVATVRLTGLYDRPVANIAGFVKIPPKNAKNFAQNVGVKRSVVVP